MLFSRFLDIWFERVVFMRLIAPNRNTSHESAGILPLTKASSASCSCPYTHRPLYTLVWRVPGRADSSRPHGQIPADFSVFQDPQERRQGDRDDHHHVPAFLASYVFFASFFVMALVSFSNGHVITCHLLFHYVKLLYDTVFSAIPVRPFCKR